jgi:hypothetical protein
MKDRVFISLYKPEVSSTGERTLLSRMSLVEHFLIGLREKIGSIILTSRPRPALVAEIRAENQELSKLVIGGAPDFSRVTAEQRRHFTKDAEICIYLQGVYRLEAPSLGQTG